MRRTGTNERPVVRPVIKAELSEKNSKRRLIVVIVLILLATSAFTYGIVSYLGKESGWTTIVAKSASERNCSDEFVFQYCLGASGASATAEGKEIQLLYTDATVKAYQLFNTDETFDDVHNMAYLNQHPNEEVKVDDVLYQAFYLLEKSGNRSLYLGPVYEVYDGLFSCTEDYMTADYDPQQNDEAASFVEQVSAFSSNSDAIQIELLGNDKVKLKVSDEYLAFAKENEVTDYIDFYWMKNAFIIDYLADVMIQNNYTLGSISSYNGFVRNLDESGNSYSYNLYDREENTIYGAGVMDYTGAKSIVYLRNYRMTEVDDQYFYEFENGEIRNAYLDAADGKSKTSLNNLVCYATDQTCTQILLHMMPVYISDSFDASALSAWVNEGIYSIYCTDHTIFYNEDGLKIHDLYEKDGVTYTTSKF